ncbi:MAG: hypothetical protein JO069_14085 [Verrucomicrobia bacterium]|nr:hypothetical protein [Verrucomicrobiota bacterium]
MRKHGQAIAFSLLSWLPAGPSAQAGLISPAPGDPGLVRLGAHRQYYRFASDSGRWWHYGLGRAPVEEPTPFTHGYGTDVIAIPFDAAGRVTAFPVYIYTIRPESYEENKLARVMEGVTSKAEVTRLFGSLKVRANVGGYEVWFYGIRVYNPFTEFPDRGLH